MADMENVKALRDRWKRERERPGSSINPMMVGELDAAIEADRAAMLADAVRVEVRVAFNRDHADEGWRRELWATSDTGSNVEPGPYVLVPLPETDE